MVAIAFLGGLLVNQNGSAVTVIPLLVQWQCGAQRLLPALQQIYISWSSLKGFNADLIAVLKMLNQPLPRTLSSVEPLILNDCICLKSVSFSYGLDEPDVLQSLNLRINRGECIGFVGSTGSGKSTAVDLIMGLLEPKSGHLLVICLDLHDAECPSRLASWRSTIAHVPQNIYLADGTILRILLLVSPHFQLICLSCGQQSRLDFILYRITPQPIEQVGERGIRLSGGQRQRLGIARALTRKQKCLY